MKGGPFAKLDLNRVLSEGSNATQDIFTQFLGGPSQAEVAVEQAKYAAEAAENVAESNALASLFGGVKQTANEQAATSDDNTRTLLYVGAGAALVILAIALSRR